MRKLVPETYHWHMKQMVMYNFPWKVADVIYKRYSRRSVEKTTMTKETVEIIIRGIIANIKWDLYENTYKNKIA